MGFGRSFSFLVLFFIPFPIIFLAFTPFLFSPSRSAWVRCECKGAAFFGEVDEVKRERISYFLLRYLHLPLYTAFPLYMDRYFSSVPFLYLLFDNRGSNTLVVWLFVIITY